MVDIVVLGDVNVDVIARFTKYPTEGSDALADSIEFHGGGSAANTAMALSRMGCVVSLISRLGSDPWASVALSSLHQAGVLLTGLQQDPAVRTGLIYIVVTPGGERTMLSYRGANAWTDAEQIREEDFVRARLLHLSGYALLTEPQRSAVLRAVELAENHALTISLDPGLTPATLDDLRTLLARIDILLPTLAEAQAITGLTAADDCALALLSRGVQTVALKLGKDGCLVSSKDGRFRIPAFPIEARDSTGAGDSFDAGFLMAHLKGLDSHACAVLANAMGALAAAQVGAGTQALTPQAALFFLRERRYTQGHQEHSRAIEQVICFLEGVFAPPCFV